MYNEYLVNSPFYYFIERLCQIERYTYSLLNTTLSYICAMESLPLF